MIIPVSLEALKLTLNASFFRFCFLFDSGSHPIIKTAFIYFMSSNTNTLLEHSRTQHVHFDVYRFKSI